MVLFKCATFLIYNPFSTVKLRRRHAESLFVFASPCCNNFMACYCQGRTKESIVVQDGHKSSIWLCNNPVKFSAIATFNPLFKEFRQHRFEDWRL